MNKLELHRYEIFFVTLLLQLIYPFIALLLFTPEDTVRLISFSILVLASFNLAKKRIPKVLTILFGTVSAIGLWCCYLIADPEIIEYLRIYATCFFYITLIYTLTHNFLIVKNINLKVVIGAMSGYLLIGFLGASTIEMMEYHYPSSFIIKGDNIFDFTYFSFVSMLTVGFGDIVPNSTSAKSLTILISVIGQFYMAVGIASLVGKFMNK